MPFAGQNQFFDEKTSFSIFFRMFGHKLKKHENSKKTCHKWGLPAFGVTLKHFLRQNYLRYFGAFLSFFLLVAEKDEETCFNAETNDFDQQTACGAPVP